MANEKRLIEANALKDQIENEIHTYWTNGTGGYCLAEDVIPDIDNAPTVDAVEVVRCKDCKHYIKSMMLCMHGDGMNTPDKMDFCSHGERRTENV